MAVKEALVGLVVRMLVLRWDQGLALERIKNSMQLVCREPAKLPK
jgi:hypothetical protein